MNGAQKRNLAAIAVVGVIIYALTRTADATPVVMSEEVVQETGNANDPSAWIPGVNLTQNVFGAAGVPFYFIEGNKSGGNTTILGGNTNVNIPDFMLGSLSRQYVPLFGFVGVTAVGSL